MKLKKLLWWIPLLLFAGLSWVLMRGLLNENQIILAPQINKAAPAFNLPELEQPTIDQRESIITEAVLKGQVTLVNFWATWCPPCHEEHPVLVEIVKEYKVNIIGINYKDQNAAAVKWLNDLGNPYSYVLVDANGRTGIDWGVIGVPETFVVDREGIVRYKHMGPITWTAWETELWPLINQLSNN